MKFFTAAQAAKKLGVTTKTLERWRNEGRFSPVMKTAGGHSRYSSDQIDLACKGIFDMSRMKEIMG